MCLIIDACLAHHVFSRNPTEVGQIIRNWTLKGENRLVFGGEQARELFKLAEARRWIRAAWQAGKARQIDSSAIEKELTALRGSGVEIKSNDLHVLALALASGAQALFTEDQALMDDFRTRAITRTNDRWILNRPEHRKKLYSSKTCCAR